MKTGESTPPSPESSTSKIEMEEFEHQLEEAGIDLAAWGQGEAKTTEDLLNEVTQGETLLEYDEEGRLFRRIAVGRADIYHRTPDGKVLKLKEDRQEFRDGRVRVRGDIGSSVSEKMKFDEDPAEAMVRGIEEELGIEGSGLVLALTGDEEQEFDSPSYPGVSSVSKSVNFVGLMPPEQFRPEGYIEHQPDKDTHFIWEEVAEGSEELAQLEQLHHSPDHAQAHEALIQQLHESASDEEKSAIRERFGLLVSNVLKWAERNGHDVHAIERLGGGFKNPVVMLTTRSGEQYVAKGFAEEESLETTKKAQAIFSELCAEDESRLIPRAEIFNDTLFSDKAEGAPIKTFLREAIKSPQGRERARRAFIAAGATVGFIHERTERPIRKGEATDQEVIDKVKADQQKLIKHIEQMQLDRLLGLSPEQTELLKTNIASLTEPEFITLIHADAHLDQFFYGEGSLVEIVDYDDIREGDPMADVGRLLASLRDWCARYDVDFETEIEMTRALAEGYHSQRKESGMSDELEMDSMRVVVYEMRLYMIQLKQFDDIREDIKLLGEELGLSEAEILKDHDHHEATARQLGEEKAVRFKELQRLTRELQAMYDYLKPAEPEELLVA